VGCTTVAALRCFLVDPSSEDAATAERPAPEWKLCAGHYRTRELLEPHDDVLREKAEG
jgi:hypothetical protein